MENSGSQQGEAGSEVVGLAVRDNLGFNSRWGHDQDGQPATSLPEISNGDTWRSIPRAPGYEASALGKIRRVGAKSPLKQRETPKGYRIVDVAADGRPIRTVMVHCLVADAWKGPRPPGMTLDHVDDDKADNRPHRIEYVSNLENQRRRWARLRRGEQLQLVAA